jgi:hypothetical protein
MYIYTLVHDGTSESYDEAMAVACLQGIMNRESPEVYVLSPKDSHPSYWLDLFSSGDQWLAGVARETVADLDALFALAADRVTGAVIWDPEVPASIDVATTIAGTEDAVVLSPEFADLYLPKWKLPVLRC